MPYKSVEDKRRWQARYMRALMDRYRAAGVCVRCAQPVARFKRCLRCRRYVAQAMQRVRERQKRAMSAP